MGWDDVTGKHRAVKEERFKRYATLTLLSTLSGGVYQIDVDLTSESWRADLHAGLDKLIAKLEVVCDGQR